MTPKLSTYLEATYGRPTPIRGAKEWLTLPVPQSLWAHPGASYTVNAKPCITVGSYATAHALWTKLLPEDLPLAAMPPEDNGYMDHGLLEAHHLVAIAATACLSEGH